MRLIAAFCLSLALHALLVTTLASKAGGDRSVLTGQEQSLRRLNIRLSSSEYVMVSRRQTVQEIAPEIEYGIEKKRLEDAVLPASPSSEIRNPDSSLFYWPLELLSEPPQIIVNVDLDKPEVHDLIGKEHFHFTLLINAQGTVDSVQITQREDRPELEPLRKLLAEYFSDAQFSAGKVMGVAVPVAAPITVGIRP